MSQNSPALDLAQAAAQYQLLFDANPQPMWVYDVQTLRFLAVNNMAVARYGWTHDEFLAMTIADIRPPESVPLLLEDVRHATENVQFSGPLWQHRRKDGTPIWVEIASHTIVFDGVAARMVVAHDVTERKQAEDARRESEARLQSILDNLPAIVYVKDQSGRLTFVNRQFDVLFGQNGRSTVGLTDSDLFPAALAAQYRENDRTVLESGQPLEREETALESDGPHTFQSLKFPLRDAQNQIYALCGISTDITERKRLADAMRENDIRQRTILRDVLRSVTQGKLHLCNSPADLPPQDPHGPSLQLTAMSLCAMRHRVAEAAASLGFASMRGHDLLTGAGEAAMNAVVHAGSGEAHIGISDQTIQVRISDRGAGISMERLPQATLERGYTTSGTLGHGFWMMLETIDRVWLLTGPSGTTVVLEQDREVAAPSWLRF